MITDKMLPVQIDNLIGFSELVKVSIQLNHEVSSLRQNALSADKSIAAYFNRISDEIESILKIVDNEIEIQKELKARIAETLTIVAEETVNQTVAALKVQMQTVV